MELKVKRCVISESVDKDEQNVTAYKCTLEGVFNGVKGKLVLESESKESLEEIVPQVRGIKRRLVLERIDLTLPESTGVPEGQRTLMESEDEERTGLAGAG
jgi:hypothetical protein